ncbi:TadE family protein [Roseburia hominis]
MLDVKKSIKGSTIVEMAYLMPVVLLTWMLIVFALFYYHDKNIVGGAAYETAVTASEILHEKNELPEGEMEAYFRKRIYRKLLFFGSVQVQITSEEGKVSVKARAVRRWLVVSAERNAAVTVPEERIRKIKSGKEFVEDIAQ